MLQQNRLKNTHTKYKRTVPYISDWSDIMNTWLCCSLERCTLDSQEHSGCVQLPPCFDNAWQVFAHCTDQKETKKNLSASPVKDKAEVTITHTYTLNMRVHCACNPHAGASFEMNSKKLWETEKTGSQYIKENRVSTSSFRVGGGDAGDRARSQRSRGGSDSMHKQTTYWRGDGRMHPLRPDGQGTDIIPKEAEEGRGRTFGKKERIWSEMPSSSMAYLLLSFFFFLITARQGTITTELSECWEFWRAHLSTCRQLDVSIIV